MVGIIFALAGAATWYVVEHQLAAEKITVSEDARFLAGRDVTGPFTAYAQADGFFRASLYTSVVAFGVAAMAVVLGVVLVLVGAALRSLAVGVVAAPSGLPSHV